MRPAPGLALVLVAVASCGHDFGFLNPRGSAGTPSEPIDQASGGGHAAGDGSVAAEGGVRDSAPGGSSAIAGEQGGDETSAGSDGSSGAAGTAGEPEPLVPPARRLALGYDFLCLRVPRETTLGASYVWCIGHNDASQRGIGGPSLLSAADIMSWTQTLIRGITDSPLLVQTVAAAARGACAVSSGRAWCWGTSNYPPDIKGYAQPLPVERAQSAETSYVEMSGNHSCLLTTDGTYCWGDNSHLEIDEAYTKSVQDPAPLLGGRDFTAVALADETSFGIAGGYVYCWGRAQACGYGLLDLPMCPGGESEGRCVPSAAIVMQVGPATSIAAGGRHACAISEGGSVVCWGDNEGGRARPELPCPGPSCEVEPASIQGSEGAQQLALGFSHSCLLRTGQVFCWGEAALRGRGPSGEAELAPVLLDAQTVLSDVVEIDAADARTCALTAAGLVYCWGYDFFKEALPFATALPDLP